MTRPPHACVYGRFVPFKATELRHASNDALRVMALVQQANDNSALFGGGAA